MAKIALLFLCVLVTSLLSEVICANSTKSDQDASLEASRTFVHHAAKRLAVLIPVVFFTLGIAFTLLIVVTLISTNNLIVGFLLLVLGLAHVLARFTGFNANSTNSNNNNNGGNNPGFAGGLTAHNLGYLARPPITAYYGHAAALLRRQDDAGQTQTVTQWPSVTGAVAHSSQSANVYGNDIVQNYHKYLQANSG